MLRKGGLFRRTAAQHAPSKMTPLISLAVMQPTERSEQTGYPSRVWLSLILVACVVSSPSHCPLINLSVRPGNASTCADEVHRVHGERWLLLGTSDRKC